MIKKMQEIQEAEIIQKAKVMKAEVIKAEDIEAEDIEAEKIQEVEIKEAEIKRSESKKKGKIDEKDEGRGGSARRYHVVTPTSQYSWNSISRMITGCEGVCQ